MRRWLTVAIAGLLLVQGGACGPRPVQVEQALTFAVADSQPISITLKTAHGTLLCAEEGGGPDGPLIEDGRPVGLITGGRQAPGPWETFSVERIDDNRIALKSVNGFYVTALDGGGGRAVANRVAIGAWEVWRVVSVGDGRVALQANGGLYLRADDTGSVWVDAQEFGSWSAYTPSQPIIRGPPVDPPVDPIDPPQPPSGERLQGLLRREGPSTGPAVYRDDRGPQLPKTAHLGDTFSHWVRGRRAEVLINLQKVAAAGYDGVRVWLELPAGDFWISRSGEDLRVAPAITDRYYEHYESFLVALRSVGLRLQHSWGGLDASLQSREARREHVRRIAEIDLRVGLDSLIAFEVNEPMGIGAREPAEVADFLDLYTQLTGGRVLTGGGSPYGYNGCAEESSCAIDAWSLNRSLFQHHSYRGGNSADRIRHLGNIAYELKPEKWLGLYSEPPGPDEPVSVGKEQNAEAVALLHAMGTMARGIPTMFNGRPGIFSRFPDGRWADYNAVPGFLSSARLVERIHRFAPDLHSWRTRAHVRHSARVLDIVDLPDGLRVDQVIDLPRRQAVSMIYWVPPDERSLAAKRVAKAVTDVVTWPFRALGSLAPDAPRTPWDKYSKFEPTPDAQDVGGRRMSVSARVLPGFSVRSLVGGETIVVHPTEFASAGVLKEWKMDAPIAFERGRVLLTKW